MKNPYNALKVRVEEELSSYTYNVVPEAIGNPWHSSRVDEQLVLMRRSLVEPYLIEVQMEQPFDLIGTNVRQIRHCVVVADANDGYLLVFDLLADQFLLTQLYEGAVQSIGVRGDSVGCFLSR